MNFNSKVMPSARLRLSQVLLAMKLTAVFIIASLTTVSANSYSQIVSLHQKNTTITEVLRLIEKQTNYHFLYEKKDLARTGAIDIDAGNVSVEEALNLAFRDQPLTYKVFQNTIVIRKTENVARVENLILQTVVRGKVTDTKGESLPGVSVKVKGSTSGAATDVNGNYSISVSGNGTLVFSYIGFTTKEVAYTATTTTLNVTLNDDSKTLEEVVVIGYGTAKKSDLTGAVSSVSAADIDKVPVATIDQSLQGRSSGVQVQSNDGSPGGGITVQIRGVGSFGNTSPLYVVDGYPISGGLNSINPADIQSMDILKDASAAAIYGNRASNGVVIITTKRGSNKGGVQISLDAQTAVQSKPEKYDVMNAEQFVTSARTVRTTDNYTLLPEWAANEPSTFRNVDWQDAFYQTGLRQQYNLAIRGGGPQVQSSFSLGYYDQSGIVKFSGFKRYNASLNLDYTPYKWLKATTSLRYTQSARDGRVQNLDNFLFMIPTITGRPGVDQIKDENGVYGYYSKTAQATRSFQNNVFADAEERRLDQPNGNFIGSASLEATLFPGFKVKTNFGANTLNGSSLSFQPGNDRGPNPPQSSFNQNQNQTFEWLWENTASYIKTFGKHSIDAVAGVSAQENKFRYLSVVGVGSISNDVISGNNANLTTVTSTDGYTQYWSLASQFGRLTYKFADKYILTGTVRRDGSSRFGSGQQWGVFPSVSAAWKVKEESFLKNVDAISDFKIRASWGKAGNQDIDLFAYQGPYSPGASITNNNSYVFGDKALAPGLALNGLPNAGLTWEKNTQTDLGLELSFLNNRINITADYYKRLSTDFLLNVPVPAQTGFQNQNRNVGEMQNTGFELGLSYRDYEKTFKWSVGINASTIKNRINSYREGLTQMYNTNTLGLRSYGASNWTQFGISRVGNTIGAFYGFLSDGIIQDPAELAALNANAVAKNGANSFYIVSNTRAGDRKFVDLNNDGRITDADRQIIGNPLPKVFGGVTFDGSYKQFDFNVFIYASIGNDIFNYARRQMENFDAAAGVGLQNFGKDFYFNHWTPENRSNTYSRLVAYDQSGNNRPSDAYIEDGSFARLKNVQIGYTLPASLSKSLYLSKLRIYVSGQNLLTVTKYSGLDPEIGNVGSNRSNGGNAYGIDLGNYPTSKYFTLGLNVGF